MKILLTNGNDIKDVIAIETEWDHLARAYFKVRTLIGIEHKVYPGEISKILPGMSIPPEVIPKGARPFA